MKGNTPDALKDVVDQDATLSLSDPTLSSEDLPGGRYEILSYVTSGGSGAIFKARHVLLDKVVAIKLLNHESAEHLMRFQQEAKTLAKLSHPNIIQVLELGSDKNGGPYLVMDWFEGCTLREHLAKLGAMPLAEAIPLLVQICRAISAAHRQGVLHRDIKPSNIMVARNRSGHLDVKLVDFGIAKDIGNKPSYTQSGAAIGTPLYMSPEQAAGKKISVRSDLYSLGCVMYEVFTGHPPFEADSSVEVLQKHRCEQPPKLKAKNRKVMVPPHIEALIYKLLSKAPEDRPESAQQVAAALEGSGEAKPSLAKILFSRKTLTRSTIALALLVVAAMIFHEISGLNVLPNDLHKWLTKTTSLSKPKRHVPETLVSLTDYAAQKTRTKTAKVGPAQKAVNWARLGLNDESLAAEVGPHWQIEKLFLTGNPITDKGLKSLSILPLEELDISYTAATGSGLKHLQKPELLKKLNMDNAFVTNEALNALKSLRNLDDLSVSDNQKVTTLTAVRQLHKLTRLSAGKTKLDYKGLLPLEQCQQLIYLKLSGVKMTPAMIQIVSSLKNLRVLEIKDAQLTDESIKSIAKIPNLIALNIGDNRAITRKSLDELGKCPRLEEIYIAGCAKLTEQDIQGFRSVNPVCRLILKTTNTEGDFNVPFVKSLLGEFRDIEDDVKSKQKSKIDLPK